MSRRKGKPRDMPEYLWNELTGNGRAEEAEEPWPEPRELDTSLPPVVPFTASMLPAPLGEHVAEVAKRMDNVAPDFIAAPLVVGAAAVIGRGVTIRPKARDDWEVVPNVWGANVGPPSSMKTPAQKAGLAPVSHLSERARKRFREESKEREIDTIEAVVRAKHLKQQLQKAIGKDNPAEIEEIKAELRSLAEREEPTERRYATSDATVEKLAELLVENPNGLLNERDELMGWLATLDRAGHEGDRAFFLESWDGRNPFNADRIGRGSLHVPGMCLSIFGGIQPGPLKNYVRDALSESEKADGLLQRFQVLVWPDPREYERSDEAPVPETRLEVAKVFEGLANLDAKEFGAQIETFGKGDDERPVGLPYVRFSADAQEIYNEWRDEFEPRVRSGEYPAAVESHLIKYRSLFPSLALIFEAIEFVRSGGGRGGREVGETSALRAAVWCEYLESHAMRLYHPAIIAPTLAAQDLLDYIEAGSIGHRDSLRDVHVHRWPGLASKEDVLRATRVLEGHGWIRLVEEKPAGGGRPSTKIHLQPTLRGIVL